jgi:hypothetical protein
VLISKSNLEFGITQFFMASLEFLVLFQYIYVPDVYIIAFSLTKTQLTFIFYDVYYNVTSR